jgi:hypothetical protein
VNLERHQRRIHWKARLVRWGTPALALLAAPAWLYLSYGTCQDDGDQLGSLCRSFRVIPFLPMLAAAALLGFVVWDLAVAGHERAGELGEEPGRRGPRHVARGYRAIGADHRRHIHRAFAVAALVTLAVGLWIARLAYVSTH